MPTLNLFTNVPVDAVVASDILKDATKAVAKIIGKPESYVMILVNGGVPISFGGTEEPAAYGELISIGGLGPSVNAKLSATIAEILQTKLSIESSRFYIKFYDVQAPSNSLARWNLLLAPILRVQWLNFLTGVNSLGTYGGLKIEPLCFSWRRRGGS
ncbi:Macrophage migration inhibitory factor [Sesamum angolense]|uniref:L-dopachrome isomerase n=1 Tax=Sesamum angolense TaxID=2727404 RepID=A0AAE2BT13_9LAMI|nr:Macrophage migration inhibitory factor [Sesamum angolense]